MTPQPLPPLTPCVPLAPPQPCAHTRTRTQDTKPSAPSASPSLKKCTPPKSLSGLTSSVNPRVITSDSCPRPSTFPLCSPLFFFHLFSTHHPIPVAERSRTPPTNRAIENGANALAESFLFTVAALLILGEAYRTSSKQSKRRDDVDEKLDSLLNAVERLQEEKGEVEGVLERTREEVEAERKRREALERVVERLVGVGVGMRSGGSGRGDGSVWDGTPLRAPRVESVRSADDPSSSSPSTS
ncbi:hypothetical protein J3R83DRAFT_1435 [Lanmaoa asiatica]|nr:hypothetical protein J3R83DRAFT_1435 [Lanmaoa asiatica]